MTLPLVVDGDIVNASWFNEVRDTYPTDVVNAKTKGGASGNGVADDRAALATANTLASALTNGGVILFPHGTYRVASNITFSSNVVLWFLPGARLSIDSGVTVTIGGFIRADETHIFAGSGSVNAVNQRYWYARWFGALGDDSGDDGGAINRCIAAAQASRNGTVVLGAGVFRHTTQIALSGANKGVRLEGAPGSMQNGSGDAACVLKWAGGASAQVLVSNPFNQFVGIAFANVGTATHAIKFNDGGRAYVHLCSFVVASGWTAYSTAAVEFANVNYDHLDMCEFAGGGAPGILVSGTGTTLRIGRTVFDLPSGSGAAIKCTANADLLQVWQCTWNAQLTNTIFLDMSTTVGTVAQLSIRDNEFDGNALGVQLYVAKIKNVHMFRFSGNDVSAFGSSALAPIQVTNSRGWVEGNYLASVGAPLVATTDTTSYVYVGVNNADLSNTKGILDDASRSGNLILVTPAAGAARIKGNLAPSGGVFQVTATTADAFEVQVALPTDGDRGFMAPGQVFTVMVKNSVGGAMGAVTFSATFKTSGAFTTPANGKSRSITFQHNGTNAVELSRSGADVDN